MNWKDIEIKLKNFNEIDKMELGDTMLKIVHDKTNLIYVSRVNEEYDNRVVYITINEDYINKLNTYYATFY